ncbi:MAG: serine/threonine protein kinase [Cyanobacteria bacterium]|nr:serine/threonine protein kinase [Cyanobacteriota bacterium]
MSDVNEAAGGFEDSQIGHDRVIGVANGIEDPAVRFDDFVGRVIDERLVLTSFIAEGGMGGVFKAYDRELNRELCVKLMLPELVSRSDSMKRFQREARNLSKLDLPDVVRVFQFGVHDGYPFLAMEYAEGEPLSVLAASRTPPAEAIELTIKICRALSRVHEAGLVHRDLKPDNILVVDRATHQIKLIDFGLSALDQRSSLTQSNVILGTPVYLAPECFRSTSYSPVVDIYSVGCILFELVTGERLFRSTSLAGLLAEKSLGANSSLPADSANLETRQRLEVIIQKCCAAPLDKRFQDCDSVIHALQAVQRCCSNTEFEELLGGP